jgi:hypothetical protein
VATVLLALAAVATAWSSYQAARWNGEQAKATAAVNKARIEAARASGVANAQTEIDVATFTQWVDAYATEERELADFYFRRFRPEFKPAVDAWIATRPLRTPDAPLTPFAMPQYKLAARAQAERLDRRADVLAATARRNIQRSTNYVLGVVLFAVALFFAGMSTKVGSLRTRKCARGHGVCGLRRRSRLGRDVSRQYLRLAPLVDGIRPAMSAPRGAESPGSAG